MPVFFAAAILLAFIPGLALADGREFSLDPEEIRLGLPMPAAPAPRPEVQMPVPVEAPPVAADNLIKMSSRVLVKGVRIEGDSRYPFESLAGLYAPMVGKEVPIGELIQATSKITERYQQDGYLLSYAFLPADNFRDGVIRVVIVEGYVGRVEVTGDVGPVSRLIERYAEMMGRERPLRRSTFEHYAGVIARVPGVTASVRMPPPSTTDGAAVLTVEPDRKAFSGNVAFLRDGNEDNRLLATVSSNSQTAMGEQLSVSVLLPPGDKRDSFVRVDYEQAVGPYGTRAGVSASQFRNRKDDQITVLGNTFDRDRKSDRYSVYVQHPIKLSSTERLFAGARLRAADTTTRFQEVRGLLDVEIETRVRAVDLEMDWRRTHGTATSSAQVNVSRGGEWAGARTTDAMTDLDFTRVRVSASHRRPLGNDFEVVMSGVGFWSPDSLPESEQLAFGGAYFGRGYPTDQATGDRGWGGMLELNRSFPVSLPYVSTIQPYLVFDAARTRFNERPFQDGKLSSAGIGLRLSDNRAYTFSMEVAKPTGDRSIESGKRDLRYTFDFNYHL